MRTKVKFPLGGLEQEVEIVFGPDDFKFVLKKVEEMYLYPEKIASVKGRGENAAFYLDSYDEHNKNEFRIISILDEAEIKYAIERYHPQD